MSVRRSFEGNRRGVATANSDHEASPGPVAGDKIGRAVTHDGYLADAVYPQFENCLQQQVRSGVSAAYAVSRQRRGKSVGPSPVSYTHLTLPTNREV